MSVRQRRRSGAEQAAEDAALAKRKADREAKAEALAKMTPDMDKQVGQMMQRCAARFADDPKAAG